MSKSPATAHGLGGHSPTSAEEGRLLLVTSLTPDILPCAVRASCAVRARSRRVRGDSREVTRPPQQDATLFPTCDDKRELVIGRDSHGYLALYRYMAEFDTVFVLAVKGAA